MNFAAPISFYEPTKLLMAFYQLYRVENLKYMVQCLMFDGGIV